MGNGLCAGVCIVDRSLLRALLMMIAVNLHTWSNMVPELQVYYMRDEERAYL